MYNGHLRGPVTLTPTAKHLAVELSLPIFTTLVCRGWESNTKPFAFGVNALTHCVIAAVEKSKLPIHKWTPKEILIQTITCLQYLY